MTAADNSAQQARQLTYLDASLEAITQEMRRDPRVFVMGQDVRSALYGRFGAVEEFGEDRIRNLPISEAGFVGAGVGAALTGLRPVIEMTFSTFLYSAMDQVVNQAAKIRYMTGGQAKVPLVLTATLFYGGSQAAHHNDRPVALFANSPGLKILVPSTPHDIKGLMLAAIREEDPVLIFRDASLAGTRGPVPEGDYVIEIGSADVKREGTDITVISFAGAVPLCLAAAQQLEAEDISVEVVDLRSLVPLDLGTVKASVEKTGRVVAVDLGPRTCSFAGEIVSTIVEDSFWHLKAPPARVTVPDVPVPFSPTLERHVLLDADRIAAAVRRVAAEDHVLAGEGAST